MFRSARWRREKEKNKIKAVFKLQFHATEVEGDAFTISLVPEDVGKPTARLEKALVRDRCCYWLDPVYETMKFTKETRSGKMNQKIYSFLMSKITQGSSKSNVVGEVSIDFASYVEATKIYSLSLPLRNSKSDAILHVKIQRVLENDLTRNVENDSDAANVASDNKILKEEPLEDIEEEVGSDIKTNTIEDDLNRNDHRVSSGSNFTISSSDSSFDTETPSKYAVKNDNTVTEHETEFSDFTTTDDSRGSIEEPKTDMELQTLRKQIVNESKRAQDLAKEVATLKEDRDALNLECDNYKAFHKRLDEAKDKDRLHFNGGDAFNLLEELRQELSYEKDLNVNLRLQLCKTQESNSELILAIHDLDETLEQKNKEQLKMQYESTQIENLENELKKISEQLADCFDIISKHELHIQNLEEEIENQAEGFKADLDTVTRSTIEHQQRAIKSEESLRKIRLQNASTAERLQKEFRKLSFQMTSTSEANETIATKAMEETSELRLEKHLLEEMLLNEKEHLKIVKDQYEEEICELEQELQYLKRSMEETEDLLERWSSERNEMESIVVSLRKEADEFMDEITAIGNLEEVRKRTFDSTKSELETLILQCHEFKQVNSSSYDDNKHLRNIIVELEKRIATTNCSHESLKGQDAAEERNTPIISANLNIEMEVLMEKHKCMEDELNEMQRRYSGLSLRFAEVEGERQQLIMTLRNLKNPKKMFFF
ncbi:myosin-J heavy chain-like [Impatiens glandulifera]|uniref:myosin-J heavy chain-like n=1 Tax=Impatiens glandulifera TaxID=253017 RepID=UPI001FB04DDB|nr:myosin-J heavy chain-like [Impatiens glandulifera]